MVNADTSAPLGWESVVAERLSATLTFFPLTSWVRVASVRHTLPERSCVVLSCAREVRRATGQRSDSQGAHAGGHQKSSERRRPMKAIVQDTYGKADVLELRDIAKPLQGTYGSADVQTATGGTR